MNRMANCRLMRHLLTFSHNKLMRYSLQNKIDSLLNSIIGSRPIRMWDDGVFFVCKKVLLYLQRLAPS